MDLKRLFFGIEAKAPWPEELPPGRVLLENDRHMTLAFLGETDFSQLDLENFPNPPFMGLAALFDRPLFLPHKEPNVAAWHVRILECKEEFLRYQKELIQWLKLKGTEFLPHVTIARKPFEITDWKEKFQELPLYLKDIHLFESLGHSKYKILWTFSLPAPFDEMEHTADLAFRVRGENLQQIHLHAELALSFHFPPLIRYFDFSEVKSLEEIVSSLNGMITRADSEIGCPFKAVSFHGSIEKKERLEWEMIVDV